MTDAIKSKTMKRFMGINNRDNATRIDPVVANHEYVYPLSQGMNVDIDNTFGLSSRSGYTSVITGTDIHSLWSEKGKCLLVDGYTLFALNPDFSAVEIRAGLMLKARMSYALVNDRIYWTNGNEIGNVRGFESFALQDPGIEFKQPLPPGQLIEIYRGCLYVAKGNVLYISDPLCDYYDIRRGYRVFSNDITLLRAVDDGIYVGDDKIWWVKGDTPEQFDRLEVYGVPAIIHTAVRVNGQYVGDGVKGNVAIWTGTNGICVGDNSGSVINATEPRFTMDASGEGAAFIREKSGVRQYINSLY